MSFVVFQKGREEEVQGQSLCLAQTGRFYPSGEMEDVREEE